jgi:ADP-heptose:LPS heptosyltransferase
MDKEKEFKKLFQFTSLVTDVFPRNGARVLDLAVRSLLGNTLVLKAVEHQARRALRKTVRLERILIAADLNIGDAVIAQAAVSAAREIFPEAVIDCVVKQSAGGLIEGNPEISTLYPLYEGAPFPLERDLEGLARISAQGKYDLVINFSPMVDDRVFGETSVVNYSMMAAELIRNESRGSDAVNNVVYQSYRFIGEIFRDTLPKSFGRKFKGAHIYLSEQALNAAEKFLESEGISKDSPIVMVNPDASARFTRMPFDFQLRLLRSFSEMDSSLLLGAGHVEKFIEHELLYSLPPERRKKITIIPASTNLDVYTALIDLSDVFVSGDTGPLHLAAARKYSRSSGASLRNRTAVLSVFGGTPSRIYGYDSQVPGFLAANQDAPSRTFVAESRCRNITCINKMAKTCREVRCFQSLDPGDVVLEASRYLESARNRLNRERVRILVK